MAMEPALVDTIQAELLQSSVARGRLSEIADGNLTQGLGVIHNVLIQQAGGVADDAAIFAALSVADRTPVVK